MSINNNLALSNLFHQITHKFKQFSFASFTGNKKTTIVTQLGENAISKTLPSEENTKPISFSSKTIPSQHIYQLPAANDLRVADLSAQQALLDQISFEDLSNSTFYQNTISYQPHDLTDRNKLFQFLLLFNYPLKKVHDLFAKHYTYLGGGYTVLKILPFGECACSSGLRASFDGKQTNKRAKLEQEILSEIEKRWGDKKNEKLVLTSIGSGGCLQEWVLLSKLVLMGFKHVEIHLADLNFKEDFSNVGPNLTHFFKQFPDIKYEFHFHHSFENFAQKNIQSDILLAIDWEKLEFEGDEPQMPVRLTKKGFFYFNKEEPHWLICF